MTSPTTIEGWQPIETAPKDGKHVILGRAGQASEVARWINFPGSGSGWFSLESDSTGFNLWRACPPTHWQPLPDPPESHP